MMEAIETHCENSSRQFAELPETIKNNIIAKFSVSDPFISLENCIERLLREWRKHPRLIVALDFDDTAFDWLSTGNEHKVVLDLIRECQKLNFYIVMWTASDPARFPFIQEFMRNAGIDVSSINENPIELPFGNHKKIYYNILLDDRAGLGASVAILQETIRRIKEETEQ